MHSTRKTSLLMKVVLPALAAAVLAFSSPSESAPVLDFDQAIVAVTGTLVFDGGAIGFGSVTGSAISFDRIKGFDTPFNNLGILTCAGCSLSFETGTLVAVDTVGPITVYSFGAGGSISVDGTVLPDPGGVPPHPGTVGNIVTGAFSSATLSIVGSTFTFSGLGTDTKDDALVEYYFGIGSNDPAMLFRASTTELGGTGAIGAGGSFTSTRLDLADFNNRKVPEPGTGLLVLLGVSALVTNWRRKR